MMFLPSGSCVMVVVPVLWAARPGPAVGRVNPGLVTHWPQSSM